MALYDQIVAVYPELATNKAAFMNDTIILEDLGTGAYIKVWNYTSPIPPGLPTTPPPQS